MDKLNKYILWLGMIFYTLQGPYVYTYFFIISFLLITIAFNFKFSVNFFLGSISIFILLYVLVGLLAGNPSIKIEIKNWLFWLASLNLGLLLFKYLNNAEILKILSISVLTLLLIYFLLNLNLIPNIYLKEELAEYHDYKTVGPYIVTPILYQFYYLYKKLPINREFWFISICSIIIVLISGSLQYLLLISFGILFNTIKFNLKRLFYFFILTITIIFTASNFLSVKQLEKIGQIFNPLESLTVQTRIDDVIYAYKNNKSNPIIGNGLGVRSTIERVSAFDHRLIDERDFLEVDNGFYYIYHRTGILGVVLFFILILKLQKNLPRRLKYFFLLFIFVNCFLSIHLFTVNLFALIFSFFIFISRNEKKKYISNQ